MDVGGKGSILLHNMDLLGIDPNNIDTLVFSHGHYDHTGGLPEFLDAREKPIKVIAHPAIREKKRAKVLFVRKDIGFPYLTEEQEQKMDITYTKEPVELLPGLFTTGEIRERPERDGSEPTAQHLVEGKWAIDPVWDDISVIVEGKEGQTVIAGCAHAGILNILNYTRKRSSLPIAKIVGGTHMVRYKRDEVLDTARKFELEYDNPDLYLNHCTDKLPVKLLKMTPSITILEQKMPDKIKHCYVGTSICIEH